MTCSYFGIIAVCSFTRPVSRVVYFFTFFLVITPPLYCPLHGPRLSVFLGEPLIFFLFFHLFVVDWDSSGGVAKSVDPRTVKAELNAATGGRRFSRFLCFNFFFFSFPFPSTRWNAFRPDLGNFALLDIKNVKEKKYFWSNLKKVLWTFLVFFHITFYEKKKNFLKKKYWTEKQN